MKPQFDLQQVSVQYVDITATALTSLASLSLNILLMFTAVNPKKVRIKYYEYRFTVMYRGILLGEGIVSGFYQPARIVRQVGTIVTSDLCRDVLLNDRAELRVLDDVQAEIQIMLSIPQTFK